MSSNILSRMMPNIGARSIYDTLHEHDRVSEAEIDEQNLGERFHDQDLDELLAEAAQSGITTESTPFIAQVQQQRSRDAKDNVTHMSERPAWPANASVRFEDEDDVPDSMLYEGDTPDIARRQSCRAVQEDLPPPIPGPPPTEPIRYHERTRISRHEVDDQMPLPRIPRQTGLLMTDPKEKAMWRWANVVNLDAFLVEVYDYYLGKGIWSILLSRLLSMLTFAFVGILLSFLTFCIDYGRLRGSKTLPEVVVPQCTQKISGINNVLIWLVSFMWIWKSLQYLLDIRRLYQLHDFYLHLLGIPDIEMQTISWQAVVSRLMNLREENPRTAVKLTAQARHAIGENSTQRMDAHDIANRIMRKENYLIALFNKDVLDISLPIPLLGNKTLFSKTLEWNINFCVMDIVFNNEGQVRQLFLKDSHRKELIDMLRRRFIFAGYMNAVCAPFLAFYLTAFYILRFFIEFQRNPAALGARAYTPLAEWKFREFNELWHMFQRRIDMSYPFASRYIDQFPKDKTVQFARFVAFIAGALGAVLAIASLLDPDVFFGFEITHDRTVLFYLGILGTIWAVTRGVVPEENLVFDPEFAIQNVIDYTHYQPAHWKNRLHSDDIRQEFAQLYRPKVLNFSEELLSIIFTPFILWFSLPRCSARLVDFFREFTVHVDGLGYVCSFALFEFQKGGPNIPVPARDNRPATAPRDPREAYYATKDNKMLASYFNFLDAYGNNPRGVPAQSSRRRDFQPPPTFPGISTSQMTVKEAPALKHQAVHAPSQALAASIFREQPVAPLTTTYASPSPSLLLDPRHQPQANTTPRRQKHHNGVSRLRDVREADLEAGASLRETEAAPGAASVATSMEESHLGESWKTTRAGPAQQEDRTSMSDVEGLQGEGNAGVLGMIYQFQKAQTEGRAGVGI